MKVLQILALPIALVYSIVMRLRNFLYNNGIISSVKFKVPVICIGNLSLGGTGKSPHMEYIIELLGENTTIATLSRGYGRKTKGFILVDKNDTSEKTGDEPLQFKKKYNRLLVAVCENRVKGIKKLLKINPQIKAILLDDAFQHRRVKPGLSILLTDYHQPFYKDFVVPSGTLREPRSGAKRADIIIVTKIPELMLEEEKEKVILKIKPLPHQQIYFSRITYGDFIPVSKNAISNHEVIKEFFFDAGYSIVLFTGIANSAPLVAYLQAKATEVEHINFSDHHDYTITDIEKIYKKFYAISNPHKVILTTEKDAMRLNSPQIKELIDQQPVYFIPIKIELEEKGRKNFNKKIQEYVR